MRLLVLAFLALVLGQSALAQNDYRIQPGDVLSIEVLQDPSLNREVLVLPDGRFSFPFAGIVQAGGRTIPQVEATITAGIAGNFAVEPNVFVSVRQLKPVVPAAAAAPAEPATIDVFFLGEVKNPGGRKLAPGTTLLQALAESGGFTGFAAQKRIQLRRTDPKTGQQSISVINYRAIANGAVMTHDFVLTDGDVILVPERRLFE